MTNLKKISIDGIEVEVDGAMTLIQAAEVAGVTRNCGLAPGAPGGAAVTVEIGEVVGTDAAGRHAYAHY